MIQKNHCFCDFCGVDKSISGKVNSWARTTQQKTHSGRNIPQPTKTISLFFLFLFVSSYVGDIPAIDDLGNFCFVWRCEFSSKCSFVSEEKSTFRRKVLEAPDLPKQKKFWEIQKRFTKTFDSWLLPQYCWSGLFRYKELTIHLPLVSFTANLSKP